MKLFSHFLPLVALLGQLWLGAAPSVDGSFCANSQAAAPAACADPACHMACCAKSGESQPAPVLPVSATTQVERYAAALESAAAPAVARAVSIRSFDSSNRTIASPVSSLQTLLCIWRV